MLSRFLGITVAAAMIVPSVGSARVFDTGSDPVVTSSSFHGRSWGPEQAAGAPDTHQAGDIVTAWASLTEDDQDEWLLLTYRGRHVPTEIRIHETYNPGALTRVIVFDGKREVEVWKGTDPVKRDAGMGVAVLPVSVDFPVRRVKLYLDSTAVKGWNEIDAVGLKDAQGKLHWAARARASSTYASQY